MFIVRYKDIWSSRIQKMVKKKIHIPGIIRAEKGPGVFWVSHYGEPNHFTPPKQEYGRYRIAVIEDALVLREPDYADPMEF